MNESQVAQCHALLGVEAGISAEDLKKAYLKKSYALIRSGAPEDERVRLRTAHERLAAHLEAAEKGRQDEAPRPLVAPRSAGPVYVPPPPPADSLDPFSFDSRVVNWAAVPLVAGVAILVTRSFLGFFLQGFIVWIHEFGHATVAWLTGKKALPLPIGWTNISAEQSLFVYFGILFLLGLLFAAGWIERKIWPMVAAVALAGLQAYMTWRLPAEQARMWIAFAGCGGQFYLSALMVGLFYFEFPEKFKWGACRYVFLFLGASSFFDTFTFWRRVQRGAVPLPYGSMVNGEEDASGDLDTLSADFGWSDRKIIATYNHLGTACLVALVVVYVCFALRLDRLLAGALQKIWPQPADD